MQYRIYFPGVVILLIFLSCLTTEPSMPNMAYGGRKIRIISGNAVLRIDGRVNENLYAWSVFSQHRSTTFINNPTVQEGSITKSETKIMSAGQEYNISLLPSEVVTINIRSIDDNDVEISVYRGQKEERYTIDGSNTLGLFLAFQ